MDGGPLIMELLMLLVEVVVELLVQWPIDSALARREKSAQDAERTLGYWLAAFFSVVAGLVAGLIGMWLWPGLWPTSAVGRVFMLAGAPLLVGIVVYAVNAARETGGKDWVKPWRHAGCAALFALAWAITRTVLGASP